MITLVAAFSLPYTASSATPNISEKSRQTAAERLAGLKVVTGRSVDGNLDLALNANITRAELVTVIVRAFGQDNNAKLLAGASSFPDVKTDSWASGYIAMAKALIEKQGGTVGLPDGSFNPDGKVTGEEAVAFLMIFLGAQPDSTKTWLQNYISGVVDAGLITDDDAKALDPIKNNPATRGLVFYFADHSFSSYKLANGKTVYTTFVDTSAPTLTVDTPPSETKQLKITLTGTVTGADAVKIGNNTATIGADGKWTGTLDLNGCGDTYSIVAIDLAGNTVTKQVTIKFTGDPKSVTGDVYSECTAS